MPALALAVGAAFGTPFDPAIAGGDAPGASDFATVVTAWQSRSASAVRATIPAEGRLRLDLLGTGDGPVTGQPTAEQAEAVLEEYFGEIDSAALVDASGDAKGLSRTYDYTYRPTGAVSRTTRLTFTLTATKSGGYGLAAVVERAKKT